VAGPHPAVAQIRSAVRPALTASDQPVLVACSGGADSLALAAAVAFEAPRAGVPAGAVTVDHGLQPGSAARADATATLLRNLGLDPVRAVRVQVGLDGGPEAAARTARYRALRSAAADQGARIALGHTLDDQAETVLLGLTRGSGGRSIAGMRPAFDRFHRPLLGLTREQTEDACRAEGIEYWDDPHNADPRFTRTRIRHRVMPVLEQELGPGVAAALARTAEQLRPDMEALDLLAEELLLGARDADGLVLSRLEGPPDALVGRVLRLAALDAGSPGTELFHVHVQALGSLLRGSLRGDVQLPGHLTAYRSEDHLRFRRTSVES